MVLYARQTVIILLLLPVVLLAQFQKNNAWKNWKTYERTESATVDTTTYLLDRYPAAAAAYSLRLLDADYAGNAIKVRRSSDNAEQDISFSGAVLDTVTLKSFVGAGSGYVVTWYDQSGNGNDATQTTDANQPMIVNTGSVVLSNGSPSVQFDGTSAHLLNSLGVLTEAHLFYFAQFTDSYSGWLIGGDAGGYTYVRERYRARPGRVDWGYINISNTQAPPNTEIGSIHHIVSSDYVDYYRNSILIGSSSSGGVISGIFGATNLIGLYKSGTTSFLAGMISELILYPSDQSANRTAIEGNINSYYGIY